MSIKYSYYLKIKLHKFKTHNFPIILLHFIVIYAFRGYCIISVGWKYYIMVAIKSLFPILL